MLCINTQVCIYIYVYMYTYNQWTAFSVAFMYMFLGLT